MGMTIDEAIRYGADVLEANKFLKDKAVYEFLAISFDSMCKYQKIQHAYETWLADGRIDTHKAISMISEIINEEVEDENKAD